MPIPTCEITKVPFEVDGDAAPRVLPCRHVYSLAGIRKLVDKSGKIEASCPRCSAAVPKGVVTRLPRHKKLCTLVRLLTSNQTDPACLNAPEVPENIANHDGGYPVYSGTLRQQDATVPVHVKVIPLTDAQKASRAWRELVMMLQVTQALGRSVVRTVGYVEQPGRSLKIVLEASNGSVLRLRQDGRIDCEFGMRLAERVTFALEALHATHIIHCGICPSALRLAYSDPTSGPASTAVISHSSNNDRGVRVMLAAFSDASAVAPPDYTVPNAHATAGLAASLKHYAAPERLDRANGVLRKQTDMYAFAATMYYLVTGQTPQQAAEAEGGVGATGGAKPGSKGWFTNTAGLDTAGHAAAGRSAASAVPVGEKESGAPPEFFELLRECLDDRAECRPAADEASRRLAYMISKGFFDDGKFYYHKQKASSADATPALQPNKSFGSSVRALIGGGKKGGFRFSSMRDKLYAMVCVAKGADSSTVSVPGHHPEPFEAYTMPVVQKPSESCVAPMSTTASEQETSMEQHVCELPTNLRSDNVAQDAETKGTSTLAATSAPLAEAHAHSVEPAPPTRQALRSLDPSRASQKYANLTSWIKDASSNINTADGRELPSGRLTHPLALEEQASVVLTKLGFPKLAVGMAVSESAGVLEDSLKILLGDKVLDRCRRNISDEYDKLQAAAQARAQQHPGTPSSVMTADLWDWVEDQAGAVFGADDVNAVLQRSAGAEDDEDVSLEQFTHVVVHMFEQFFKVLDKQGTGYLTQEELREAFFADSTEDVTAKLRDAMEEIDVNHDGGISLNELLRVGLGGNSGSRSSHSLSSRQGSLALRRRIASQESGLHAMGGRFGSSPSLQALAEHGDGPDESDEEAEPLDQLRDISEEMTGQLTGEVRTLHTARDDEEPPAGSALQAAPETEISPAAADGAEAATPALDSTGIAPANAAIDDDPPAIASVSGGSPGPPKSSEIEPAAAKVAEVALGDEEQPGAAQ